MRQNILARCIVAPLLASLFCVQQAMAQAVPTATSPGSSIAVGGTYSMYQTEYGQRVLGGAGFHLDINPRKSFGLEAEARWLRQNQQANTHENTYLIGPRYQTSIGSSRWKPYFKVLVGLGVFNFPYDYQKGQYFVVAPGAGLECRLNDTFSLRVIDIEYQRWPQFTYGPITPYGVGFGITWRIFNGTAWESATRHPRGKHD
jgi:hypothetical protein